MTKLEDKIIERLDKSRASYFILWAAVRFIDDKRGVEKISVIDLIKEYDSDIKDFQHVHD